MYIYIYLCIYTYIYLHIHIYICMCICIYMYVSTCQFASVLQYTPRLICVNVSMHILRQPFSNADSWPVTQFCRSSSADFRSVISLTTSPSWLLVLASIIWGPSVCMRVCGWAQSITYLKLKYHHEFVHVCWFVQWGISCSYFTWVFICSSAANNTLSRILHLICCAVIIGIVWRCTMLSTCELLTIRRLSYATSVSRDRTPSCKKCSPRRRETLPDILGQNQ